MSVQDRHAGQGHLRWAFPVIKAKTDVLMTEERANKVIEAIRTGMRPKNFLGLSTRETKREHLASLEARNSNATMCPKCDGKLVLRTMKSGQRAGQQFYDVRSTQHAVTCGLL